MTTTAPKSPAEERRRLREQRKAVRAAAKPISFGSGRTATELSREVSAERRAASNTTAGAHDTLFYCKACGNTQTADDCDDLNCDRCGNNDWSPRTTAGDGLECPECGALTLQPCAHSKPVSEPSNPPAADTQARLEYLRTELRAERISYGELTELQSLAKFIDPSDVELLEAAGVAERRHYHEGNRCCFCEAEDDHECVMCPDYDGGAAASEPSDSAAATARDEHLEIAGDPTDGRLETQYASDEIVVSCGVRTADVTQRVMQAVNSFAAMRDAGSQMMKALRHARDTYPAEWDVLVTPEIASAWTELSDALKAAEGKGAR